MKIPPKEIIDVSSIHYTGHKKVWIITLSDKYNKIFSSFKGDWYLIPKRPNFEFYINGISEIPKTKVKIMCSESKTKYSTAKYTFLKNLKKIKFTNKLDKAKYSLYNK